MSSQAVLLCDPLNHTFALSDRAGLLAAIEVGVWPADTQTREKSKCSMHYSENG